MKLIVTVEDGEAEASIEVRGTDLSTDLSPYPST